MKEIIFIRNMSELGAGTRGASLGFAALKMASVKFGKRLFVKHPTFKLKTFNDDLFEPISTPFAKHIEAILKSAEEAGNQISKVLLEGKFPFIISGDHSNAASTIYAIKKAYPKKRLGVIWIDAHGDLHSPYTTPSGNMHGMPLAISLGEDNIDKKRNDAQVGTVERWNEFKNIGGLCPKINAADLVFFAVRDTEVAEDHLIKKHGIRNFKVEEIRHKGIKACIDESNEILKNCDLIYISFDVDSMDCNLVSRGTGTPVENGLNPDEAQLIMESYLQDDRLVCLETVEINPLLDDKGNKMAETTLRILDNLIRKYTEK